MLLNACVLSTATGSRTAPGATSHAGPGPSSPTSVGQVDDANPSLPSLPKLTNVVARQREDSVGIDFDPVDDAIDYRVYPSPSATDITVNANGSLTIANAVYHCAGLRQTFDAPNNLNSTVSNGQTHANADLDLAIGGSIYPPVTTQILQTPTLGYVMTTAQDGFVPVYAIGVHPADREEGWRESRPKIYITDSATRQTLLAQGGRDDGIVFYAPTTASTQTIYHSETITNLGYPSYAEFYFADADRATHASDTTPPVAAFQVLSAAAAGSEPLMAVLYQSTHNHTELAVGKERYARAANQGPGPLWHVEWPGITQPTTLVVEALASGCPFQGFLSPQSVSAPPHQPLFTLAQLQQASATGEVFVNGQYDIGASTTNPKNIASSPLLRTPDASPIPIARSYVQVTPQPHDPAAWDWYQGFGGDFGPVTAVAEPVSCACQSNNAPPCNSGSGSCGHWTSPTFDIGMYEVDNPSDVSLYATGNFAGQFWDVFSDWAQDVTATLRFTVPQPAHIDTDPSKFLHITWSVNTVGTDRRYPQMIVSDQPAPIQDGFKNPDGNFVLIQTIVGPAPRLQAEAFHGLVGTGPWAVNNQAPLHALVDYDNKPSTPADSPFEHSGMDRMTTYDAYFSSSTLYLFMDGAPAACMQYPGGDFALSGPMSVTFGDVFYHEGAPDELVCYQDRPFTFLSAHQCTETARHWDDLGFKTGVSAPAWDTTLFPCTTY